MYIKINKNITSVTDVQAYTYFILAYAELTNKKIGYDYLLKSLNIKDKSYLGDILSNLEENNLIKRNSYKTNSNKTGKITTVFSFKIVKCDSFYSIDSSFINNTLSSKDKGFALKLMTFAFTDNATILYNRKEMASKLNMSYAVFCKRFKSIPFIKTEENVGHIFTDYYIKRPVIRLSKDRQTQLKHILYNKKDYPEKIYNQIKDYCEKKLFFNVNADLYFDNIMAGLVNKPKGFAEEIDEFLSKSRFAPSI